MPDADADADARKANPSGRAVGTMPQAGFSAQLPSSPCPVPNVGPTLPTPPSRSHPMTLTSAPRLAATLAALVVAALLTLLPLFPVQAAAGKTITPAQAEQIKRGMAQDDVRQLLGEPAQVQRFRDRSGPTWSYTIMGGADPKWLDIDFTEIGMVISVKQRLVFTP